MRSRGGLGSLRGVEEVSFFKLSQKKLTFILPPGFFIFYFCFNGQMFKIRALLLFTFGFLVCSVKSDSASGCCASWYGMDAKPCTDCTNTFNDANNFICWARLGRSQRRPSTESTNECMESLNRRIGFISSALGVAGEVHFYSVFTRRCRRCALPFSFTVIF